MLIDSHCHLDFFDKDELDSILNAAREQGVEYFLSVCTSLENFPGLLAIAEQYENIYIAVGVHPSEQLVQEPSVEKIAGLADNPLVVGIGECGLDYHYDSVAQNVQQERFRNHIRAARKANKPLVVHTREAGDDTLRIMQEEGADQVGGVMHCFTGIWDVAKKAIDMNFYISFAGIITFKNAGQLREVAKLVPLDKMLIETDAPYLAPEPFRGKQNQPAYVYYVAECLAKLKNMSNNALIEQICANFFELFDKKIK